MKTRTANAALEFFSSLASAHSTDSPATVTVRIQGNRRCAVRLQIAGQGPAKQLRIGPDEVAEVEGPVSAYVYDAITRRLLFQLPPATASFALGAHY